MPAWIKCPNCDEYFCTIHLKHVPECNCPPRDDWPVDPYAVVTYSQRKTLKKELNL